MPNLSCGMLTSREEFDTMTKVCRADFDMLTGRIKKNEDISKEERELWFWRMLCFLSLVYGSTPAAVLNLSIFAHCKSGPPPDIFEQMVNDYAREVLPLLAFSLGEKKCDCADCRSKKSHLN